MGPEFMTSLAHDGYNTYNVSESDFEVLKLFLANSKIKGAEKYWYREGKNSYAKLHLIFALVNHSCASNASNYVLESLEKEADGDLVELRAIKKMFKGEEITICATTLTWKSSEVSQERGRQPLRKIWDLIVNAQFVWAKFLAKRRL